MKICICGESWHLREGFEILSEFLDFKELNDYSFEEDDED